MLLLLEKSKSLEKESSIRKKNTTLLEKTPQSIEGNSPLKQHQNPDAFEVLKEVFTPINEAYAIMDFTSKVLWMNSACEKLLGYDIQKEQLRLIDLPLDEYKQDSFSAFGALLEKGEINDFRTVINTKTEVKRIDLSGSLIRNKEGKPIAAHGIVREVHNVEEFKETIDSQKNQLELIVNNSLTGILLTRLVGAKLFNLTINDTLCEILGFSKEDISEANISAFMPKEDSQKFQDQFDILLKQKSDYTFTIENRYITANKRTIWAKTYVSVLHNRNNKIRHLLTTVEDITAKKSAEIEMLTAQKRLKTLIANLQKAVLLEDENRKILITNPKFCKLFGIPSNPEDMIGLDCKKAAEETKHFFKNPTQFVARIDTILRERKLVLEDELEIVDGRFLLRNYIPIFFNNTYKGHLWTYEDVTEKRIFEMQKEELLDNLKEQNERLKEYAHMVSHDLKSPLRNVSAMISWFKEDFESQMTEEQKERHELIQSNLEKMDLMIENILKYSSLQRGSLVLEKVNLKQLIRQIVDVIYIPENFTIKIAEDIPEIIADNTRVYQIFQNMISNAINHNDKEKGIIEVNWTENTEHFQFSVKDNGVGIPKKYQDFVFKIFYTIKKKDKSSGIGLSIVKKIIELHEGSIWLESEPGKGTTFHFTISKKLNENERKTIVKAN